MKNCKRSLLAVGLVTAVVGCGVVCWPAAGFAVAIYDADVTLSVSAPGPIPSGTGIALFQGAVTLPPPETIGNASSSNSASASVPGVVHAAASGQASARPNPVAGATAAAASQGALL